jgi:hypothetical protein
MALTKVTGQGVGTLDEALIQRASSGGTATSGSVLIVEDDDNTELSLLGGSSSVLALNFGHSGDNNDGKIDYNTTSGSEEMRFFANALECISIKSSGVIKPNQPCFSATASSTNIPLATTTKVTLSSERFDVGNNVASDTFTAPITGKYLFTYILFFSSLDADHTTLDATIKTSNTQYQQTVTPDHFLNSDSSFSLTGSMLCDMDANDTFHMNVYVSAGAAQTDIHTDSHVSGVLIC